MKKLLLYFACCFALSFTAKAQLSVDSITTIQNILNDTVPLGSNLNFNVEVNYSDTTPFTGTIYLMCGVDSSGGLLSIDTVGFTNVNNITSNDSVSIFLNDTVLQQNGYRTGGNIVVVWPIADGLLTLDTFTTIIYVTPTSTSVNENKVLHNQFSIYPNPTQNFITIKNSSPNNTVKHVRIYAINGTLLYQYSNNLKIDISRLTNGSYLLEIELENKKRLSYKLLKM